MDKHTSNGFQPDDVCTYRYISAKRMPSSEKVRFCSRVVFVTGLIPNSRLESIVIAKTKTNQNSERKKNILKHYQSPLSILTNAGKEVVSVLRRCVKTFFNAFIVCRPNYLRISGRKCLSRMLAMHKSGLFPTEATSSNSSSATQETRSPPLKMLYFGVTTRAQSRR
jgi:hypothetical protein